MRNALSMAILLAAASAGADVPASPAAAPAAVAAPDPAAFAALPDAERRTTYNALTREQQTALLGALTQTQLVAIAKRALAHLGTYEGEMTKQERVDGKLLPPQTMRLGIREDPYAIRLECIAGAPKGRKVLYNSVTRPKDIRAKESGFLGIAGGVWVDKDGSLAKGDTNHVITDTGFASTIRIIDGDLQAGAAAGGLVRKDEGFDANGWWCMKVTAPPGAKTYAVRSRLCFDPVLGLPVSIECEDAKGVFERFTWRSVKHRAFTDADFTPDALGI